MESIPKQSVPRPPTHVAIIMDGNGRWAAARGLPRTVGHQRGIDAVRRTVEAAGALGVDYLTLYGFSTENWNRPFGEITELMRLLRFYLRSEVAELHKNNVRLRVIGDRSRLAPDIAELIRNAEATTQGNTALHVTIALSYGGRQEIVTAARRIADDVRKGLLTPDAVDETTVGEYLFTYDMPDPDLVIRTSGEKRISNFLLWQSAYAELVFIDTLWPDFTRSDLEMAIGEFHRRERRYGATVGS
jgi:undecaprenyl diphosphate synthase